jgi:hypothetical protein
MPVLTGARSHIMLVHIGIQMKMVLIANPDDSAYCWIACSKTGKVTPEANSPGCISLMKGLLHLNFVWKQLHVFSNYSVR